MDLASSIRKLLLRHNCVVVPDFGGFIASISEAVIDHNKGLVSPPKKRILFNKHLVNNDGLLIHQLAADKQINYETAIHFVAEEVSKWKEKLHSGQKIVLEQLGNFYLDQEHNLQFEQDRFFNLLLSSFGLSELTFVAENQLLSVEEKVTQVPLPEKEVLFSPVELPAEKKITPIGAVEKRIEAEIIQHPASKNLGKKLVKYAVAACLLPIAFYTVWIPVKTNVLESGVLFKSDFNPFHKQQKAQYEKKTMTLSPEIIAPDSFEDDISNLPENVSFYSYKFSDDVYIPVKISRTAKEPENIVTPPPPLGDISKPEVVKSGSSKPATGNFRVIVGSFSQATNAEKLVSELKVKGFEAFTMQDHDRIRVCAGSYHRLAEADRQIEKLLVSDYPAWILK